MVDGWCWSELDDVGGVVVASQVADFDSSAD